MQKILVVEDDFDIQELLQNFLQEAGYDVTIANDGVEALSIYASNQFDLILLDIMLPKIDGFSVCELIREQSQIPIIMLTALSGEEEQIRGFDLQVDDYITKPFNFLELIARVKSNLRRYTKFSSFQQTKDELLIRGLYLNKKTKEVKLDDKPVKLTPIEFKILQLLMENPDVIFSIEEIYEKVWNEPFINSENTVAVHIRRIREKIEVNPKEPIYLKVVWGIGYKISK